MLFTANVDIPAPYIVVSRTNTLQGITSNSRYVFGLVQRVYAGCNTTVGDQTVFYDNINAIPMNYGGRNYWAIKESAIILYEQLSF